MENLIAVFRTEAPGKMNNRVIRYGWTWIKKQAEAKAVCEKKLEGEEKLTEVWSCKWKDAPSKYELVFGYKTAANESPNLDMAADLRKNHLKTKKGKNKKPHIKLVSDKVTAPVQPRFRLFVTKEARSS